MARSFFAKYWATNGGVLLGGVLSSSSCRFQRHEDADRRLQVSIEANGSNCTGQVVSSNLYPEIFIHCGTGPAQAIGGKCFRCGKVLTKEDARNVSDHQVHLQEEP